VKKAGSEYLKGNYWEEQGWPARAYEIYASDPSSDSIIAKARIDMDSGLFEKALDTLAELLFVDTENAEALLYAAICLKKKGDLRNAEAYLSRCRDNANFIQNATVQLAEISIIQRKYQEASDRLKYLKNDYQFLPYPAALQSLAFRKNGDSASALKILEDAEKTIPFEPLIYGEKFFLENSGILKSLRFQMLIEILTSYVNINEYGDALKILNAYIAEGNEIKPLICYYKNYRENNEENEKTGPMPENSWDFIFRCESEKVMNTVLEKNPDDNNAIYHLGNFYAQKRRWNEALACWQKIEGECKSLALRGEGLYWWKITQNTTKAVECYAQAASLENCGAKTLWEYDHLLSETGNTDSRLRLFEKHKHTVSLDNRLLLRKADALISASMPDDALEILINNQFSLCEGKILPRLLYEEACWQVAERFRKEKKFDNALEYLMKPLEYPEHLGVGKPTANMEAEWYWRCGQLCIEKGDGERAEKFFRSGIKKGGEISIDFFPLRKLVWQHDDEMLDLNVLLNLIFRAECYKSLDMNSEYSNIISQLREFIATKTEGRARLKEPEIMIIAALIDPGCKLKTKDINKIRMKIPHGRMLTTISSKNSATYTGVI